MILELFSITFSLVLNKTEASAKQFIIFQGTELLNYHFQYDQN